MSSLFTTISFHARQRECNNTTTNGTSRQLVRCSCCNTLCCVQRQQQHKKGKRIKSWRKETTNVVHKLECRICLCHCRAWPARGPQIRPTMLGPDTMAMSPIQFSHRPKVYSSEVDWPFALELTWKYTHYTDSALTTLKLWIWRRPAQSHRRGKSCTASRVGNDYPTTLVSEYEWVPRLTSRNAPACSMRTWNIVTLYELRWYPGPKETDEGLTLRKDAPKARALRVPAGAVDGTT